jgi:predicted transcriptional regulator of viral defense system
MKTRIGRQESMFLAYAQMRRLRVVRLGELRAPLQLRPEQERELFRRMLRGQMIARVKPGVYLVPPQLPLGGTWTPSEALALNTLMEDRQGRYQICGPNAFNRYGFDTQVPNRLYAYNNRLSGARSIGSIELSLIKVDDRRLGGTEEDALADGEILVYSSRARTLIDSVYDWARFNSLPRGYYWIRAEIAAKRVTMDELAKMTLKYGDIGTIRRVGFLLEQEGAGTSLLRKLERALSPSTSLIAWIPRSSRRGKMNRRWGILQNDDRPERP